MDSSSATQATPSPPRAVVWLLLVASGIGVLLTGLVGTGVILANAGPRTTALGSQFFVALFGASLLTVASLVLRSLRWVYLLRRSAVRIPIRDAMIGYFSGLTLLFVPLLLGEMAVRGYVQRARAGVRPATTCMVNVWERLLDVLAVALIVGVSVSAQNGVGLLTDGLAIAVVLALLGWLGPVWLLGLAVSVAAWILPGIGFWLLAGRALSFAEAQRAFASSSLFGALTLVPVGVLTVGRALIGDLQDFGFAPADAAVTVLAVRVATVGVATAMGAVFLVLHARTRPGRVRSGAAVDLHFDAIADAYDAQIPEARRIALLAKKTTLMAAAIERAGIGRRGVDVGCGQGWYVGRMRERGFDVRGIDASARQVAAARHNLGDPSAVDIGSALAIPLPGESVDFVYTINVLHHLESVDEQRRAFVEIERIVKPGGLVFVHEINTRNVLFRFYMGYVFPVLNCIDEGVERWLLPNRFGAVTPLPVREVVYFTFLPEFLPPVLIGLLGPIERLLERLPVRVYSAHYMAVFQKPS